jgi:DNA-binding transcriptional ArsR family regulator
MPKVMSDIQLNVKVRFFCSATLELITSMHVLSDPEHHSSCPDWYEDVSGSISGKLLERIENFGEKYVNWSFAMDIIDYLIEDEADALMEDDFEIIMRRFENMEDELFVYIFLGETLLGTVEAARGLLRNPDKLDSFDLSQIYPFIRPENIRDFLAGHKAVKEEMTSIMRDYHEEIFSAHWNATKNRYWGNVCNEKRRIESAPSMMYVLSLHKDLAYENNILKMRTYDRLYMNVDAIREIRLFFTMFAYPHLMTTVFGNTISIYINLIFPQLSEKHEILADSIKALGDVNRLAILRRLSRHGSTNKELSELMLITPASVSQHLKILKDLNLVTSTREKNNIFYYINKDAVSRVFTEMSAFLYL